MKRTILVALVAIMAIFSQIDASAQTKGEIQTLNALVTGMQRTCKNISQYTGGVFTKASCVRTGRDIVMNMHMSERSINFSKFTAAEKEEFKEIIVGSFLDGLFSNENNYTAIGTMQEIGSKLIINIYDAYNHKLTDTVDFSELY